MKRGLRTLIAVACSSMMILGMAGCGSKNAEDKGDKKKSDVIQSIKDMKLPKLDDNYTVKLGYYNCDHMTATVLGSGVMLFCSILFLTIPSQLINLFVHGGEKEVIRLGTFCLMVAAIEQPLMGVSMILGGTLKGGGDTKTPFTISVISSWFFRLPIMLYFIYILKLSVVYVWVITAIQWSFDGLLTWYLYKKKFTHENIIAKQR